MIEFCYNMGMIIGLSGYAQSGKDSVANILIEEHNFKKIAFADKIREGLYLLNPIIEVLDSRKVYLKDLVNEKGWEEAKRTGDTRVLLQRFGTEFGRNIIGEKFWIDLTMKSLDHKQDYVITDVRFPNEADGIKAKSGVNIRVIRDGVRNINDHISESAMDNYEFDGFVFNNSDLTSLKNTVTKLIIDLKK